MIDLPERVRLEIEQRAKNWGAPTVARRHMEEVARIALECAVPTITGVALGTVCAGDVRFNAPRPEARTQEALTLLREAHMFATAQAFVADDFDAHCDRLAKFLGYTVDTHGPIKEKE